MPDRFADADAVSVIPDELPDGLVVVDGHGVIRFANALAEQLLDVAGAGLTGQVIDQILGFADVRVLGDGRSRSVVLPEGRRLLVRGKYAAASASVETAPGAANDPSGRMVLLLHEQPDDDTPRRPAEAGESGDAIAIVAHELRSPVTSVRGFTQALLSKWERFSDEQRRLMLETVAADADRLGRLITELLDVTRIDAGRLELHPEQVDLAELVEQYVERLRGSTQAGVRLEVAASRPLPLIWADRDKVERVVTNLVENALRHGAGTVRVCVADTDVGVSLTVDDEGPGIAEGDRARVFEKFWRARERSGTGLGLYIVRGLVEAHDGIVQTEQAPGGGTRFRVELPVGHADG